MMRENEFERANSHWLLTTTR